VQTTPVLLAACSLLCLGCGEKATKQGGGKDTPLATKVTGPGAKKAPGAGLPKLTDTMPSSVSSSRPPAATDPDPAADFKSIADAKAAGPKAVGKTVLFQGFASLLKPGDSNLIECNPPKDRTIFQGRFDDAVRPLMRALPSHKAEKCPRIHAKITGQHSFFQYPQGTILKIYDLQPDPAPTSLPAGVDYIAMDDALLDGPKAVGKVIDVRVYTGTVETRDGKSTHTLYTTSCLPHGGWNADLLVTESPENSDLLKQIKAAGSSKCTRVRARLTKAPTDAYFNRFEAVLTGYGDTVDAPSPTPNP
jgi:hypothetical protein